MANDTRQPARRTDTPLIEWMAGALSAALVLVLIGYLAYQGLSHSSPAPNVVVEIVSISKQESGYLVRVRAENRTHATASSLVVLGELRSGEDLVEQARMTLDYLPGNGSRNAGLYFVHDPRSYTMRIRPVGYELP